MTQPTPIAVLAGGRSPEHDVSLASAREVVAGLARARWAPTLVRLERASRKWSIRLDDPRGDDPFAGGPWQLLEPGAAVDALRDRHRVEVVFPVLHGPGGEDGTVQGMLALSELPCVGSGVAASAVAIDKIRTRECLEFAGVPMGAARVGLVPAADVEPEAAAVAAEIGFPCFAKVDTSGSSIGVERIDDEAALARFFVQVRALGRRYVAERELRGEEISVPVLGNTGERLEPLTPIGIYPRVAGYFTHEAKYTPGATDEIVPPRGLDAAAITRVQELAVRCHEALCCDGMSRTDMIVTADGPRVLEVNTLPGMTRQSLLPQAAAHDGIPFPQLLDRLLEAALRRAGRVLS